VGNVLASSGSTCVVNGPNTWEAGGHDPGKVRVGWRTKTEGLVAGGDWLVQLTSAMGLVTSNGSIPGLVGRISVDPRTFRNVTSESVDISNVETSVPGPWVSGTLPIVSKAAAASRSRRSMLNFTIAVAEAFSETDLFASPGGEAELAIDPVAWVESVAHAVSLRYWSAMIDK